MVFIFSMAFFVCSFSNYVIIALTEVDYAKRLFFYPFDKNKTSINL